MRKLHKIIIPALAFTLLPVAGAFAAQPPRPSERRDRLEDIRDRREDRRDRREDIRDRREDRAVPRSITAGEPSSNLASTFPPGWTVTAR